MPEKDTSLLQELFEDKPKRSMADQVYEQIREMIRSQKLEPGYVFPNETEMCTQMHIGRSTLREAYKQLALAGYITRTKRGTYVNDREAVLGAMTLKAAVEESSAEEFREFRYMLECQTSALAAQHATDGDLAELRSIQDDLVRARKELDLEVMMRLDKAFHVGIATATHNQLFIVSMFAVSAVWNAQVLRNFKHAVEVDHNVLDIMLQDHERILDSLISRDVDAAQEAMRSHITNVSLR